MLPVLAMIAADASQLRAATPDGLEPAWLGVSLNGQAIAEPALVLQGADGVLYLDVELLREWRVRTENLQTIESDGVSYVPLSALEGLTFRVEQDGQLLVLDVRPNRFEQTALSLATGGPGPMTRSGTGGFLNYEILADHVGGRAGAGASLELGVFSKHGSGTSTFVGRWSDEGLRVTRLETGWSFDDPARIRSVRIGDGITRGGIGGTPLRFGGIQIGRSFDVQPGFVTLPLPSISGSAALPSVVEVYVNDVLQGRQDVQPGPFQLINLPVVTGGGEVELIVRDLLGRETLVRESYYAAAPLLRGGLHDYSYEVGFLRQRFGRRSADYGPIFLSGTHRYGFSNQFTGEAHVQVTRDAQVGGIAGSFVIPAIGLLTGGAALSRSQHGLGSLIRFGAERRTIGLAFGATAEFVTGNFTTIGALPGRKPPSTSLQAFVGLPLPFGSAGISYIRSSNRAEPNIDIVSANATVRLGGLGTLSFAGRKSFGTGAETAGEMYLSIPIGRRGHAHGGVGLGGGRTSFRAGYQRNPPVGEGFGYRVAGVAGESNRLDGRVDLRTSFGSYDAQLNWTNGAVGARFTAAGSIGTVDGHVFAARQLTQSFATVRVGDFPGVRVYADNQLIGRTGRNGTVVVPQLRSFESNAIEIEVADLPMDAEITTYLHSVRPYRRSGVSVYFDVTQSRGAIVAVRLSDGSALPAGSLVRIVGSEEAFVSAPGGDVFLSNLQELNRIEVEAGEFRCRFDLAVPASNDPQPRLGPFTCERSD